MATSNPNNRFVNHVRDLHRLSHEPLIKADIRHYNSDFKVNEVLSFKPSGEGEHLFLQIQKDDCNTQWVIRYLQKFFQVTSKAIGYAGKKDRHSQSTQWFSIHLPGMDVDPRGLQNEQLKLVSFTRHHKKLRVGSIKENQFELVLRNLSSQPSQKQLDKLVFNGIPNYFGEQRFGHFCNNLVLADKLFNRQIKIKNRDKRSMVISSARSFLFNLILSQRVKDLTWNRIIDGDLLNLADSRSFFVQECFSEDEQQRINQGDLHICGVLLGCEDSMCQTSAKAIEEKILAAYPCWQAGLKKLSVKTLMRPFRCFPKDFTYHQTGNKATIKFSLNSGSFATSVLREIFEVKDIASTQAQANYLAKSKTNLLHSSTDSRQISRSFALETSDL